MPDDLQVRAAHGLCGLDDAGRDLFERGFDHAGHIRRSGDDQRDDDRAVAGRRAEQQSCRRDHGDHQDDRRDRTEEVHDKAEHRIDALVGVQPVLIRDPEHHAERQADDIGEQRGQKRHIDRLPHAELDDVVVPQLQEKFGCHLPFLLPGQAAVFQPADDLFRVVLVVGQLKDHVAVGRALDGFRVGKQHVDRHAAREDHLGDDRLLRIFAVEDDADLAPAGRRLEHRPLLRQDQLPRDIGFRARENVRHAALFCDAALVDDRNTVTDLVDDLHLVRDDDDGDAERLVDLAQQLQDRARRVGVERAGRLVAEQVPGLGRQGSCDGHALLLAAGELDGVGLRAVAEPDALQKLHSLRLCRGLVRFFYKNGGDGQIFEHRFMREKIEVLEYHTVFIRNCDLHGGCLLFSFLLL